MATLKYLDVDGTYKAINLAGIAGDDSRIIDSYELIDSHLIFKNSNNEVLFDINLSSITDNIVDSIIILEQPTDVTEDSGFEVTLSTSAMGNKLTYQWETQNPGVTKPVWVNCIEESATTKDYTFTALELNHKHLYRCKITSSSGTVVYTDSITLTITDGYDMNDWSEVQRCVRDGKIGRYVKTDGSSEFTFTRGNTEYSLIPIGINQDTPVDPQYTNCLTLRLKTTTGTNLQVDSVEALYYAEEGLAAGTYYLKTINDAYSVFTTTKAIPAGGQLYGDTWSSVANDGYNDCVKVLSSFSSNESTTALESNITATIVTEEPAEGTFLGQTNNNYNPWRSGAPYPNLNNLHRAFYGSNDWFESGIYQYLTTDADGETYWKPTNKFDRPWNGKNHDGWLKGIEPELAAVIGEVKKVTEYNIITDTNRHGTISKETNEKWFLLSRQEVNGGLENNVDSNEKLDSNFGYSFYRDNSSNGETPSTSDDNNRIVYSPSGSAQHWWLRSPYSGLAHLTSAVTLSGYVSNYGAYSLVGVVPACCIW